MLDLSRQMALPATLDAAYGLLSGSCKDTHRGAQALHVRARGGDGRLDGRIHTVPHGLLHHAERLPLQRLTVQLLSRQQPAHVVVHLGTQHTPRATRLTGRPRQGSFRR